MLSICEVNSNNVDPPPHCHFIYCMVIAFENEQYLCLTQGVLVSGSLWVSDHVVIVLNQKLLFFIPLYLIPSVSRPAASFPGN